MSIDTGEVPPHVVEADILKQEALESAGVLDQPDPNRAKVWEEVSDSPGIAPVPMGIDIPTAQIPESIAPRATKEITLQHQDFDLSFKALEVSERNYQIAVKLPKDNGFSFEPKIDSSYRLIYDAHQYTAVFMGGIFEFPSDSSITIAFMIENKEPYGEERTYRSREDSGREHAGD